jgi:type VI secretion system protein ImpL
VNAAFSALWQWLALAAGLVVTALGGYLLARESWRGIWRWVLLVLFLVVSGVLLIVMPWRYPAANFLDPDLPPLFLNHFWTWVWVFVLGISGSLAFVVRARHLARPVLRAEAAPAGAERFPDVESAWEEILIRFDQAQIDLAAQHLIMLLAPDEAWPAALVHSAGLQLFAEAPATQAPIHAYATPDGVLLSTAGASAFGAQDAHGTARLEAVCRLIRGIRPDCPVLGGVVVMFPRSWAGQPDSVKWAAAVRDDLRTVQRILKIRSPVFVLFPEMETAPGFPELIRRMSNPLRQSRCGFAVPSAQVFSGDLVQRGLIWMSGWFNGWCLSLMSDDLLNPAGNNRLFCLDLEFRRYRKRFRALLEAALTTPRESEPVLFRGCYFAATGADPDQQAFLGGLLRGARARIFAEHLATEWTAEALADDRRYQRLALCVGLGAGTLMLLAWLYIIVVTQNPWWWLGLGAVVLTWVVAVVRLSRW